MSARGRGRQQVAVAAAQAADQGPPQEPQDLAAAVGLGVAAQAAMAAGAAPAAAPALAAAAAVPAAAMVAVPAAMAAMAGGMAAANDVLWRDEELGQGQLQGNENVHQQMAAGGHAAQRQVAAVAIAAQCRGIGAVPEPRQISPEFAKDLMRASQGKIRVYDGRRGQRTGEFLSQVDSVAGIYQWTAWNKVALALVNCTGSAATWSTAWLHTKDAHSPTLWTQFREDLYRRFEMRSEAGDILARLASRPSSRDLVVVVDSFRENIDRLRSLHAPMAEEMAMAMFLNQLPATVACLVDMSRPRSLDDAMECVYRYAAYDVPDDRRPQEYRVRGDSHDDSRDDSRNYSSSGDGPPPKVAATEGEHREEWLPLEV